MLDEIVAATRQRLADTTHDRPALQAAAMSVRLAPSFVDALTNPGLAIIGEVKRRSPSRGDLAPDLDPVEQALRYVEGGAAAISVLTEPDYFSGSPADLQAVVGAVGAPVLRKDFIVDEVQVWQAAMWGAAAVLLIVAVLDDAGLGDLIARSRDVGLEPLVEVHTISEAERAVAAGATVIGVNNRNLEDFTVDLATAESIAPVLAGTPVRVAESGIFDAAGARRMAAAGYDAVLVGEALVRAPDPGALVSELSGVT